MILVKLLLVMSSLFSANAVDRLSEQEVLTKTQLTLEDILKGTQESLEINLFTSEKSFSCGLEEFVVSHYETEQPDVALMDRFVVVTEVSGPVGLCEGYANYMCYTTWTNVDSKWSAAFTECDNEGLIE